MSQGLVKIYVRNSQKYGKILNTHSPITANQLYREAATSQGLSEDQVHLYLNGKIINNNSQQLTLKPQAIIHVINLNRVNLETIEVNVRMITGRTIPTKIQVKNTETIRQFIDDKLYKVYGQKSDKLVLVHIGRQLKMDSTFAQEEIEDGSELFCVNVQEVKKKENRSVETQKEQQVSLPVKDLEVPEEPKDIYPTPNFLIETPQEINAKSNIDLLFDAKIHHATSLPNYELPPQQTIPEESNLVSFDSQDKKESQELQKQQSFKNQSYQIENKNQEQRQQVRQVEEVAQTQIINPPQIIQSSNTAEVASTEEQTPVQTTNSSQKRQDEVELSKEAVDEIYDKIATQQSHKVAQNTVEQQKENTQFNQSEVTEIQKNSETKQDNEVVEGRQLIYANPRNTVEQETLI